MIKFDNLLAGKATFTVSNAQNEHYTFKVERVDGNYGIKHFVKLLTGADNYSNYSYMGMLNKIEEKAFPTKASKLDVNSQPFKIFNWAIAVITGKKKLPEGYNILPSGTCFKCGRKLTTPESIKSGLGPHCRKMVG